MEEKSGVIYSLSDPISGAIKYVGQSIVVKGRYNRHTSDAKKLLTNKDRWIHGLLESGHKPKLEVVDECPVSQLSFWEEHYISLFKSWGFDLLNIKVCICDNLIAESSKRLMSASKTKAWANTEYREKQAKSIRNGIENNWDKIRPIFSETAKVTFKRPDVLEKRRAAIKLALNKPEYKEYKSKETKERWAALSEEEKANRIDKLRGTKEQQAAAKEKLRTVVQSESYRQNHSVIIRERRKNPFLVYKKNGEFVGRWDNQISCAKELGLHETNISAVLRGVAKSTKGYVCRLENK